MFPLTSLYNTLKVISVFTLSDIYVYIVPCVKLWIRKKNVNYLIFRTSLSFDSAVALLYKA